MADEEGAANPSGMEAPLQRADEFLRRVAGSPADVIALFGVKWAEAITFARAAPADDGDDGWTSLGPRNAGGAVRALAQDPDPAHASTFYAGTAGGGLWRTTDDGNTWEPLGDDTIGIVPVGAVAVAPSDRRVIYVGTGEPLQVSVPGIGLFRSVDGGASFQRLAPPGTAVDGAADHYTRIRVDPQNPLTAWVASDRGLWRFDGTTAHQELAPANIVSDLAIAPLPGTTDQLILLAGVWNVGVIRGVYNRTSKTTAWSAPSPFLNSAGAAAVNIGRVKVAIAPSNANVAYALVEDRTPGWGGVPAPAGTGHPQPLYASGDGGANFRQPAGAAAWPPDTTNPQALYSMALEVLPTNPQMVVAGYVNLYVSPNGGVSWNITVPPADGFITWQNNLTFATRAEHGDMHAIVFDHRDAASATPRIWVGNDGGLSFTDRWVAPFNWRKRSYGILGAQAVDVSSHPTYPSLVGCGMQDNATFFSYGGPTWYQVSMADGGALAWLPNNPRRAHVSWQNAFAQLTLGAPGVFTLQQPLPDVPPPALPLTNNLVAGSTNALTIAAPPVGTNPGVFRSLIVGDPTTANRLVIAGTNTAYLTTAGTSGSFTPLATGAFSPLPGGTPEVGALAFVPGSANNRDIYVGTSSGDIFAPPLPAAPAAWLHRTPFTAAAVGQTPWVASIAVHPVHTQVVAACAYQANPPVLLSHDGGQTWFNASGTSSTLPAGPVTSLAFHPTDETVLFAGTIVGVFVARDLPAFVAAPGTATSANPTWKSFNRGLGPLLVNDLEVVQETLTLRCGTFSRGCFEANIRTHAAGTYATPEPYRVPPVRLSIRDHAFDDSRTYPLAGGHAVPGDPRLPVANPTTHLNGSQSIDIKVNAPELRDRTAYLQSERFGHQPDGAELDEQFICENPIAGDTNIAYVQVHNRGFQRAEGVQVFLYFADAGAAGAAPALDGLGFPGDPPDGFVWQLAGAPQTLPVMPGQPRVVRFTWTCPLEIQQNVALLAICRSPDDEISGAQLPAGAALAYAIGERRAALRILPVVPDRVFIRDGLDDTGQRGSVAWGGRSPDIIVMTKAAADAIPQATADNPTAGPFANLNDARRADRVMPGDNTVFVRVHNRGNVQASAEVMLFRVPLDQLTGGAAWTRIPTPPPGPPPPGTLVSNIPARGWLTARIQLAGVPADPVPGLPAPWGKAFVLAAVVRTVNPVGGAELESYPDVTTVTGVDEFWTLFTRGPLANNAAFRALRLGP